MPESSKATLVRFLRWTERYTKTDMVYLAKGGSWLTLGQVGAVGLSFVLAVAFGHLASQDAYGNYKYILTLTSIFAAFSLSGIGTAVTQAAARGKEGVLRQGFWLNLRWSIGISVISLGGAAYYWFVANNVFAAAALLVVAVFVPLLNSFQLYDPYLVGKKEFGRDTIYNFLDALFPTLLLIGAVLLSDRAIVYVLVYFAATTAFVAFFYFRSLRVARNNEEDPELLNYSAHLSVMNFIGTIANKIDALVIFNFLGPSQLGIYAYAAAIPEQIKASVKNVSPLSMPKFAQRSIAEIKHTIWRRILVLALALGAVIGLYILLAPYIFALLFPVYLDSVPYTQLYALSILFSSTAPIGSVLRAHKRKRELYITSYVSATVLIVSLPILTWLYGVTGAILSLVIYRGTIAALSVLLLTRITD